MITQKLLGSERKCKLSEKMTELGHLVQIVELWQWKGHAKFTIFTSDKAEFYREFFQTTCQTAIEIVDSVDSENTNKIDPASKD